MAAADRPAPRSSFRQTRPLVEYKRAGIAIPRDLDACRAKVGAGRQRVEYLTSWPAYHLICGILHLSTVFSTDSLWEKKKKSNNGWLDICFCGPVPHYLVGAPILDPAQVNDGLMLGFGAQRLSYGTVLGTTFFHVCWDKMAFISFSLPLWPS